MWSRVLACLCICLVACGGGEPESKPLLPERAPTAPFALPVTTRGVGSFVLEDAFPNLELENLIQIRGSNDGTNRIFTAQLDGEVRSFANDPDVEETSLFLDLRTVVGRGRPHAGLLGFALDPAFAQNGRLYVYYVTSYPLRSHVVRYESDGVVANPASAVELLAWDQPFHTHNGGDLVFGPDGMLYLGSGDGTEHSDLNDQGQRIDSLFGAILRLRPDGSAPPDNPFFEGQGDARDYVWAYGLRNPWKLCFDPETEELIVAEVGQDRVEEINVIRRGGNYGWPIYEGALPFRNPDEVPFEEFDPPLHTYGRVEGRCATGGAVYAGERHPSLRGTYVYTDHDSARVWALRRDGGRTTSVTEIARAERPVAIDVDELGELLIANLRGRIQRLVPGSPTPLPPTLRETGLFVDVPNLVPEPSLQYYDVRVPLWSDGASKQRWFSIPFGTVIGVDDSESFTWPTGAVLVKHFSFGDTRLETRVMIKRIDGWDGASYRWNEAQNAAVRVDEAATAGYEVDGELRLWDFPAPADCFRCHTAAAGTVLGARPAQMRIDYAALEAAHMVTPGWSVVEAQPTLVPIDAAAPLADRARSYLDAQCAHCHRPGGPSGLDMDLRFALALESTRTANVTPRTPILGVPEERRLAPGRREWSTLWERLRRTDIHRMPPLGTHLPHDEAIALIGDWIDDS
ncbi:MAG: PQQ-dependent sugar dehydrogenase [Planctomycetota bacterium]